MEKPPQKITIAAETDRLLIGCGLFVFAVTTMWAVFFVPMNMDEASPFHVLDCFAYPFAPLQVFRGSCLHQMDLVTPFGLHLHEPGFYEGLLPSIYYAPFYFLFHAQAGQYALGLVFLLAFAYLTSRATAKPLLSFAVILSFFPFIFMFVHDTGPVKFAMLLFPLGGFFLKRILRTPLEVGYGYAVVWSLLLLCAIEEKTFFLYLLPSAALFALALTAEQENLREALALLLKRRVALFIVGALVVAGVLLLFFSIKDNRGYYIDVLVNVAATSKISITNWLTIFIDFIAYWPYYAHYVLELVDDNAGAIIFKIATAIFFITCVLVALRSPQRGTYSKTRLVLFGLSFASSALIFFALRNTWAGHHFVFLWTPLIVLFADFVAGLSPGAALAIVMSFFALNLWSVVALTQVPEQPRNSSERAAIFRYFADDALASGAIINFSSWGGYYIQALYGPKDQLTTYTEPYDEQKARSDAPVAPEDARALLALSQMTGRQIYNVCFGPNCTKEKLEAAFNDRLVFENVLSGLQYWRVFAATPHNGS